MQRLRQLEMAAWIAGLALLAVYGGMRAWSAHARAQGVASIEHARAAYAAALPAANRALSLAAEPTNPDTSLWSPQRVLAWREASRMARLPAAVLRVPSLGLAVPVYDGTSEINLNRGAGRIEGTARLWEHGNLGLAAHRDGFFRALKDVSIGAELYLEGFDRTAAYRIVRTQIVNPEDVHVLAATDVSTVTLVTCYPFYFVGSAPQRFIVQAQQVEVRTAHTAKRKRLKAEATVRWPE